MIFKNRKNSAGQAVLIVLLSLSVVLIIVLYVMSRTITDVTLSSKEEDSMRAFSAAEAGIERALVIGSDIGDTVGNANFSADVTSFGMGQSQVVYPANLKSGEMATFWFTRPDEPAFTGNSATICWGTSDDEPPAIEATIYYLESGVYKTARVVLDPDASRRTVNNFSPAFTTLCNLDNTDFEYNVSLNLSSLPNKQYMTVKLLYNTTVSHKIGIDVSGSGSLLPSQGMKVNSSGSFADSNRSIEVYQMHAVAPSVFMNAIYSPTGISKNN